MIGILQDEEREVTVAEVAEFTVGRPEPLLSFISPIHVLRIPIVNIPIEYAFGVVRYCEMAAWVEDPALIITLLRRFDAIPQCASALERLTSGRPPIYHSKGNAWDTHLLALDLPFIDRKKTRRAIQAFSYPLHQTTKGAPARVLIVNGPEHSGKSFTYDYIRYINAATAGMTFHLLWVDFRKQIVPRFGPAELIIALLDQINPGWKEIIDLPELDMQQPARWMQELIKLLSVECHRINEERNSAQQWYIILDGFNDPKVSRETIDLIVLMSAAATGATLAQDLNDIFRVVLLDFNEPVPNFHNRVLQDQTTRISEEGLKSYFTHYAALKNKTLEATALAALIHLVNLSDTEVSGKFNKAIAARALDIATQVL